MTAIPDLSTIERLDLSGKRVVVAGGTQGIGAGIARFAAHLGATVAIIGRSVKLGDELIESLPSKGHLFIAADLATVRGAKQAAHRVKDWAGVDNVELLFQTQGGPPPGTEKFTEDGIDFHFAVQALSRFILPYTLAELGSLKDTTVLCVASAGGSGDTVDLDNIDAKGLGLLPKASNSSAVIDAFTKEFNNRYPTVRVLHTFPGAVRTNVLVNPNLAWFLRIIGVLLLYLPSTSLLLIRTPDEYARIAMWLATSEEVKKTGILSWKQDGKEAGMSAVALNDTLRVQVWEKLVSLTGDVSAV